MDRAATPSPILAVAMIAGAALAYEILLIRIFAVVHWQALVATAISLALLGYGASGTALALGRATVLRHPRLVFVANALAFAAAATGCTLLAQLIPFDPLAMAWDLYPVLQLFAIFLLLSLPFFAAANCIGIALLAWPADVPRLYGSDLIGAGIAAVALLFVLRFVPLQTALVLVATTGALAAVAAAIRWRWQVITTSAGALLAAGVGLSAMHGGLQPAAYKDLARTLIVQGAQQQPTHHGVDGVVDVVRNPVVPVRTAPGLSLLAKALPPTRQQVFVDGDFAGTLPDGPGSGADDAHFAERLSALPYLLLQEPETVVLGAGTGEGVRQAFALGAARVDAVEPNTELGALACAAQQTGLACGSESLAFWTGSTRARLAQRSQNTDLIVIGTIENGMGLAALKTDFTLTREAFRDYLAALSDHGLLAIDVPSRVPPRLTVRLVETAREALSDLGAADAGAQVAVVRGWQRVLILVARSPLSEARLAIVRAFASRLGFDLVWLRGIRENEINRFQRLSRPLFHDAVSAVFADDSDPNATARFRSEPASDDRPFPHRFSRWREITAALLDPGADGSHLAQLDAALLAGAATLVFAALTSLLLIFLPLRAVRDRTGVMRQQRWRVAAFFGLVGIAFLYVEIAWIQRLQIVLGHPVYATTAVLATFLVFAGLGSLWSQRRSQDLLRPTLLFAVVAIVLLSLVFLLIAPELPTWFGAQPLWLRFVAVTLMLAPLAFAMGIPFPTGLRTLVGPNRPLVPWAWGINGCASVISAASAPLLALEIGFSGLVLVAVLAYAMVPMVGLGEPSERPG